MEIDKSIFTLGQELIKKKLLINKNKIMINKLINSLQQQSL